ncbi:MAG: hypothetical protein B7Z36_05950 [Novosphingobium sp. 12-63-9]|nr:MAG: hypothetical protein B7Z36_05950 [Novosphingobium sp. 12-63-9]
MEIIDLSSELYHRMPVHPAHQPFIMSVWDDHDFVFTSGNTTMSYKSMSLSLSDHSGTHVDAPLHFDSRSGALSIDQVPLENFYTEGICLDLSHVPLRHCITVSEMELALSLSGVIVKSGVCPSGSVPVRLIVHRYSPTFPK